MRRKTVTLIRRLEEPDKPEEVYVNGIRFQEEPMRNIDWLSLIYDNEFANIIYELRDKNDKRI